MAKIAAFINLSPDSESNRRKAIWAQHLQLGANDIDVVYGEGVYSAYKDLAKDLVARNSRRASSMPAKVFVATCWPTSNALMNNVNENEAGIVFAGLTDSGTQTYNRNVTGIKSFVVANLSPNWPWLLAQIWPHFSGMGALSQVAVIYDQNRDHLSAEEQWSAIKDVGQPYVPSGVNFKGIDARSAVSEIKSQIYAFKQAAPTGTGLIVTSGTLTALIRKEIIKFAEQYKLPAIYPNSLYTKDVSGNDGRGLMSYGPDLSQLYERAATKFVKPILDGIYQLPDIQKHLGIETNENYYIHISKAAASIFGINNWNQLPATFSVKAPWAGQPRPVEYDRLS